jgi:hypothetical protein
MLSRFLDDFRLLLLEVRGEPAPVREIKHPFHAAGLADRGDAGVPAIDERRDGVGPGVAADHATDLVGMVDRETERGHPAHRQAEDIGLGDSIMVHQANDISEEDVERVGAGRGGAGAVAARVVTQHAVCAGKERDLKPPTLVGAGKAVGENDPWHSRVAVNSNRELGAVDRDFFDSAHSSLRYLGRGAPKRRARRPWGALTYHAIII